MSKVVSSSDFQSEVLDAERGVLVAFVSAGDQVDEVLDAVEKEIAPRMSVVKVDVKDSADVAEKYSITTTPTYVLFFNGDVKNRFEGEQTVASLMEMMA